MATVFEFTGKTNDNNKIQYQDHTCKSITERKRRGKYGQEYQTTQKSTTIQQTRLSSLPSDHMPRSTSSCNRLKQADELRNTSVVLVKMLSITIIFISRVSGQI